MATVAGVVIALAILYFWLLGNWFAWIVMGGFLALFVQLWAPLFGWSEVEPASTALFIRMAAVFLIAGIPCFLWGWIGRAARRSG